MRLVSETSISSEYDVVWGSGKFFDNHKANKVFESVIENALPEYVSASKLARTVMISAVIDFFKSRSNTGGFVRHNSATGEFSVVSDHYTVSTEVAC
jgi:hypothetical protein